LKFNFWRKNTKFLVQIVHPARNKKKDVSESEGGFIGAKYDSLLFLETKETSPKEMIQN